MGIQLSQSAPETFEGEIQRRVEALRSEMAQRKLDAYVVPSADPHQSEYVPAPWRRRAFISGFTGSAGVAVITRDAALLWTDSRYWIQASQELPELYTLMRQGAPEVPDPDEWLEKELGEGARAGIDPRLLTLARWRELCRGLERAGATLVAVDESLVDRVWKDRPPLPREPVHALAVEHAGRSVDAKLEALRGEMERASCDAHVLTALDSIAWLFNIRGRDVECNPLAVSYASVTPERAHLFIDEAKLSGAVRDHLGPSVRLHAYDAFADHLDELARRRARVWIDPASASRWVAERLAPQAGSGARLYEKESPVLLAKAVKNPVELAGMRACHVRDGVALCRFLRWLEDELAAGRRPNEVEAADRLAAFRAEGERFQGISFETISAWGPNAAIVHYAPRRESCATLEPEGLYLVDSGGQYLDGTTDVTRTVALGPVRDEQRDRFTRVLKGHIAVATARFPEGTAGAALDALARKPLWDAGLVFGHGTGHGVGHYLCVHEGPQSLSPRSARVALRPGMIVSNEPGYYKHGAYGIRIESLVEIVELPAGPDGSRFYGFETLTLCPIDTRCIDPSLLTDDERAWLDTYHARVRETLTPLLPDPADQAWLHRTTDPL